MATKDEFDPRRAEPGQSFGYADAEGKQHELTADSDGIVRPKTIEDVATLDSFDLPVARTGVKSNAGKPADGS